MTQRRVPIAALPGLLRELCGLDGDVVAWEDALSAYRKLVRLRRRGRSPCTSVARRLLAAGGAGQEAGLGRALDIGLILAAVARCLAPAT